jgi:hypothetical protein
MSFADHIAAVDRAAFGRLGGVDVIYQPAVGLPVTVEGMLDDAYPLTDQGDHVVFLRLEDLPNHPDDDDPLLTIQGRQFRVRLRQPDGLGGIRLVIVEAQT